MFLIKKHFLFYKVTLVGGYVHKVFIACLAKAVFKKQREGVVENFIGHRQGKH
jgi:hypothetical protein